MSEETNQEVKQEHKCNCGIGVVLVILSLLFSITSLGLSTYTFVNSDIATNKKVVISKQYDKGKSLEKALETKKPTIVFFYTDWCGFCQKFVPTYHKLSKDRDIKKNFAIAYVNCEKSENNDLMNEYEIRAFPTVFVIDKEGKRTHIENGLLFQEDAVKVLKQKVNEIIND